jgi:hypothetical protein
LSQEIPKSLPQELHAADSWSDSSLERFAFSTPQEALPEEIKDLIISGRWISPRRIFLRELGSALACLVSTSKNSNEAVIHVDNTAVLFALRGQKSKNPTANYWIGLTMNALPENFLYKVEYIHTSAMPMDRYTRTSSLRKTFQGRG